MNQRRGENEEPPASRSRPTTMMNMMKATSLFLSGPSEASSSPPSSKKKKKQKASGDDGNSLKIVGIATANKDDDSDDGGPKADALISGGGGGGTDGLIAHLGDVDATSTGDEGEVGGKKEAGDDAASLAEMRMKLEEAMREKRNGSDGGTTPRRKKNFFFHTFLAHRRRQQRSANSLLTQSRGQQGRLVQAETTSPQQAKNNSDIMTENYSLFDDQDKATNSLDHHSSSSHFLECYHDDDGVGDIKGNVDGAASRGGGGGDGGGTDDGIFFVGPVDDTSGADDDGSGDKKKRNEKNGSTATAARSKSTKEARRSRVPACFRTKRCILILAGITLLSLITMLATLIASLKSDQQQEPEQLPDDVEMTTSSRAGDDAGTQNTMIGEEEDGVGDVDNPNFRYGRNRIRRGPTAAPSTEYEYYDDGYYDYATNEEAASLADELYSIIVAASPSSESQLAAEGSVEARALSWLTALYGEAANSNRIDRARPVMMDSAVQRWALTAFAYSTNYDQWTTNSGWFEINDVNEAEECSWEGVTCGEGDTGVVSIRLPRNKLSGSLPDALSVLGDSLVNLNVAENEIQGTLPEQYGTALVELQSLTLSQNRFEGELPRLGGMTNLRRLNLEWNMFSGSVPSLDQLSNLRVINLHMNDLTGQLSSSVCDFRNLEEVVLDCGEVASDCSTVCYYQCGDNTNRVTPCSFKSFRGAGN